MINCLFIGGPTASGKTEYAIKLAQDLNGEIVSADSMQIYKYMDIGSAKPTAEERNAAKHYLIDEIDPKTPFNVSEYQALAKKYIKEIAEKGKLPIICGGTGLYFNSLIYEMDFSAPEGDNDYREELRSEFDDDPIKLHEHLKELDPAAAKEIHPNNVKRVLRAIERLEKGEGSFKHFKDMTVLSTEIHPIMIFLDRDRDELYDRINRRVDILFERGLVEEVKSLMGMGFTSSDIAMKGIGYKEIIDCLTNNTNPEDAKELIKVSTRHYARRQIIWFRRYEQMKWFRISGSGIDSNAYNNMLVYIKENL